MPYTIDPQDSTQPTDTDPSGSGAAELRAIKAYIATLTGSISNPNFNFWQGFRNKLVNGGKEIDQIGCSTALTLAASGYVMDGAYLEMTQASKITSQHLPTTSVGTGSPVCSSQVYSVNAVVAAPAVGDYFNHCKVVEGINIRDLLWGTAEAKTAVFGVWVKFNVAGVYSVSITNSARDRSYVTTVTQNVGGVAEYKYITVPGDTSGTWLNTEGVTGCVIRLNLGAGTTFTTSTLNAWQAGNFMKATGAVNWISTVANTLYISAEQFERASVPTPYEVQDIQHVIARCQRYYEKSYSANVALGAVTPVGAVLFVSNNAATLAYAYVGFKAAKCKVPTCSPYSPNSGVINMVYDTGGSDRVASCALATFSTPNQWGTPIVCSAATGAGRGHIAHFVASALLT